jgi:hypothetical protein
MELRKDEKPLETCSESQSSPSRPPERKRRFQLVKLEEVIRGPFSFGREGQFCWRGL